jgi:hypothetical protein
MAFKHPAFISYVRGRGALMRGFVDQLRDAFAASIEPYAREGLAVRVDSGRRARC